jgi:hypothetical protein
VTAEPEKPGPVRRVAARLVLVVGLGLALVSLLPQLPREQTLVFRVQENHVQRLAVTFTAQGEREARGGFTLSFPGFAPSHIRHQLEIPNGEYELSIELTRDVHGLRRDRETSFVRRVTLDGGETIISL